MIDPQNVERVAIVGAGTVGSGWAVHYLACGKTVTVSDPAPDAESRVRAFVDQAWPAVADRAVAGADPGGLRFVFDPAAAVSDAQLVQESGPESLTAKTDIYRAFEPGLPADAVVATSTSGLLISELQDGRVGPERYIVGHPINPPHIIPLVEVLGGRQTDPAIVDWALAFYKAHGKHAIHVRKEVPGHLVNRLQLALWREAVHAVDAGIATVEDVDAAVVHALGLRWALIGPHLTMHLAGGPGGMHHHFEHLGPEIENWWADLGTPSLTPEVKAKLIAGMDAEIAGMTYEKLVAQRDSELLAVLDVLAAERADKA